MAKFFERLEPEHLEFIAQQKLFFVATAADGAHSNLSPKGYDSLAVLAPDRLVFVDLPGSGNQTATHVAAHGRITFMFCGFERTPLILRVYGSGRVLHRHGNEFAAMAARLGAMVGPHTRQMLDIRVQRVQTSCGYGVPLLDYRGERETLRLYHARKRADPAVDWEAYLDTRTAPQPPIVG